MDVKRILLHRNQALHLTAHVISPNPNRLMKLTTPSPFVPRRGFTIVEILVVITIVVVLAALTFNLSSRAMNSAHKSVCVTNMRGISNAMQIFASENNGRLPGPLNTGQTAQYNGDHNGSPKGSIPALATYIGRYMQPDLKPGATVFLDNFGCPALLKRVPKGSNPILYRMVGNDQLLKNDNSLGLPWGYPGKAPIPWRIDEINPHSAGRVIGMIEQDDTVVPNPWGPGASGPAHGDQRMALYFDWSIKTVSASSWK